MNKSTPPEREEWDEEKDRYYQDVHCIARYDDDGWHFEDCNPDEE